MIRALVRRGTTVILAVVVVFVFGLWSYISLPRESNPDVQIPFVIVSTVYAGVAPADVEGLITIPLENELASVTGIKEMRSSSSEGVSVVTLEFEPEIDIDTALQKVRDRVNRAQPDLPGDAEQPSVREVSFDDVPMLLVTLAGGRDEQQLKGVAEDLEERITRIPGVLEAEITGGREREIRVQVLPQRLAHFGLSLNDVVTAIQRENVNIPGGDVVAGSASVLLRTPGEFTSPEQLEGVAIKRVGDRPVFIRDVARVEDTFEERATYSRMRRQTAVTLGVKKRTGTNMLELSELIRAEVEASAASFPEGVTYAVLSDQSENVEDMVRELQNNILTALVLVVGVLLVAMGVRNSLFVAFAIPLSMLASFLVIDMMGFTLNMVVLFALILALGMLVDNAIVVVENIYRHMEMGKSPEDASVDGTEEVAVAVAASTATTVAAFFPMVFWSGIMGQFMGFLPKTVIVVLTASLVVAVGVLPAFTAKFMRVVGHRSDGPEDTEDRPLDASRLGPTMRRYLAVLDWSLTHRYATFGAGLLVLVLSFGAYVGLSKGVEFFPATEPDRGTVAVRLPEGTDVETTDKVMRVLESIVAQVDNVETYVADVGVAGGGDPLAGVTASTNQARMSLDFLPRAEKADEGDTLRVENTFFTMAKLRAAFAEIPGAEVTLAAETMGPPVGDPIAVEVTGEDFDEVGEAAFALMRSLAEIEGVTDLKSDYRVGRPEMRLRVDRGAAKRVGVSTQEVGGAVRSAIAGTEAGALRDGDDEYDILVEVAPEHKDDLQEILTLRLPGREDTSPDTFPVPLSAVAGYELAGGAGTINHVDQDLVVTITGDVVDKSQEANIREAVATFLENWDAPPGISATLGGAAEEQAEAGAFLAWAFALAVCLIVMVLVTQFNSLSMPGIIMITVVLSLVGVLWGLILTGTPWGIMMTSIGVISLAGVVVNNAIVLLDYVQQLEANGLGTRDALLRAGVTRFRPVMLTAITTTLGLVPMAIGLSLDVGNLSASLGSSSAQFWGPMAVAVIFGLTFATVLTLVMVPTLYAILVDLQGWFSRLGSAPAEAVAKVGVGALVVGSLVAPPTAEAREVTLDEAFRAAEEDNIQLQLATLNTEQARTLRGQALSAVLPKLILNAEFAINQDEVTFPEGGGTPIEFPDFPEPPDFNFPFIPEELTDFFDDLSGIGDSFADLEDAFAGFSEPTVVQPKTNWTGNLTVVQPILSGRAIPAWYGAQNAIRAAEADEDRARRQVRGSVARVYYGLASARQAVRVSEANVALSKSQLELATRQVAAGYADELAKLQAEVGVYQSERDLLSVRETLVEVEQQFQRVTGLPGDVEVVMPPPVTLDVSLDEAKTRAQRYRQDIVAAEARVNAARNERIARDLEWLPTLEFQFTERYDQTPGFIGKNFQWRAAFALNWTIFDGGFRAAKARELALQVRASRLVVEDTRQQAEQDVEVGWARVQRAQQAVDVVEAELRVAEQALQRAETRAAAGRASWLDVELARTQLQAARLSSVRERAERDLAAVDLMVAMGTYES